MKLQYLGTGAAEGIPGVFCDCEICNEVRRRGEKEFHSRAQLLINEDLSVDFSADSYYHSLRFGTKLCKIKYILVTHTHMDHFYAHDFILRGYKYAHGLENPLNIYGNSEVKKVYDECTRRELKPHVGENIIVNEVKLFEKFNFGEYSAIPLLGQHTVTENTYLYLIESENKKYLHLTDTGRLPECTLDFLEEYFKDKKEKLNLVTFDCTFLFYEAGKVSRHMGLEDNKVMREEFIKRGIVDESTKYVITHYSHNSKPFKENLERAEKEYDVIAAFDGMEINI